MLGRMLRAIAVAGTLWASLLWGSPSYALPPGSWSVGIERLFGASRVTSSFDPSGEEIRQTSISWLSSPAAREGYSSPRLALDHLTPLGWSLGGAFGFHQIHQKTTEPSPSGTIREFNGTTRAFVLAPRAGYFARLGDVGLWPRAGVTRMWLKDRQREHETAITLEVPVLWLLSRGQLGLMLTPYAELGLPGGSTDVSELGLQAGAAAFF
jgi:hypothetical protein